MKKILLMASVVLGINSYSALAQTDVKAKAILDELSKKTKSYTSISADFAYLMENKTEKTKETQEGKLLLKGDKYKLEIASQTIISDNSNVWTVLKDSKEVQVNTVNNTEENIGPNNIFSIYDKGFKYEFVKEETQKNGSVEQIVKLYPLEVKKKNFHTITLHIDKVKKQLTAIKVAGKNGTDMTYTIKKFTPNTEIPDAVFSLNPKSFPGYEIIDLRE